ncbi:Neuropeptides capa receptor [Aphelenchoides bicaudatus]|nr:Neuropeptides capa receptor [Aphelenchoides bicaudatus]
MSGDCNPIQYVDPNITDFVVQSLGPRCADESLVTPTVILYVSILVIGILGNICTCLVIFLNKSMRTPTNYYLFSSGNFGFVDVDSGFPIRARLVSTFDRAVSIIIIIWLASFLAAFPVFFIVVINRLDLPTEYPVRDNWYGSVTMNNQTIIGTEFCALDAKDINAQRTFILGAFIVFFLLPAIIITAVYSHILLKIHQTDRMLGPEQRNKTKQRKALIRMLATVVLMFFLCWIPFHVQRLIAIFQPGLELDNMHGFEKAFYTSLFYLSGCFYYSNSALNPIVYNIMSTKYRRAFIKTICCWNCSESFYTKLNLSTYSKNRNSLPRLGTRSLSQTQNPPDKKSSADSVLIEKRSVRSTNGRPV